MVVQPLKINITAIVLTVVGLIVLVALGWYFYRQGKHKAEGPQVNIPQGENSIPKGWSPLPIVEKLHDLMGGFLPAMSGTMDDAWKELRDLPTDDMVKAVYNAFNQKYFGSGSGTLTAWIRGVSYYDYFSGVKSSLLARLQNLGLQ